MIFSLSSRLYSQLVCLAVLFVAPSHGGSGMLWGPLCMYVCVYVCMCVCVCMYVCVCVCVCGCVCVWGGGKAKQRSFPMWMLDSTNRGHNLLFLICRSRLLPAGSSDTKHLHTDPKHTTWWLLILNSITQSVTQPGSQSESQGCKQMYG